MSETTQRLTLEAMQVLIASRVPVLLWGDPGTGKTVTVEAFAAAAGWATETVVASLYDPTDIGGLPVRTPAGVILEPPAWARRVAERDSDTLVFFDEINTATPATQNALMRVVLSGRVGDIDLGAKARFAAAANPPSQNSGAWDLSAPLANRFAHLRWPLGVDEWAAGHLGGWPVPEPLKIGDPDPGRVSFHRAMQTAFMRRRSELLCAVPDIAAVSDDSGEQGWPSPRTWERTAICLAAADTAGTNPDVHELVAEALLGTAAAAEYLTFLAELDLPDPEALLAEPASLRLPERSDQQLACLHAVAAAVSEHNTPARWAKGFEVCVAAARQHAPDIAMTAARTFAAIRPPKARLPEGHELLNDVFLELLDPDNDPEPGT
ncbi:AAA family ATPase [Candidatus Poriferisodalis sp.]|uniref:AAA family ATPase n=1 Tax=Candidatus Poriferisodalis sp. TaxID=3101277 RepID=UPI003C7027BC